MGLIAADRIAKALKARHSGRGWIAHCPAHEDRSPSLSVRQEGDKILVHCFAGCRQAAVIEALRVRGLWPESERPNWTPEQRADWARGQRELERVLPHARQWRRAAVSMTEELLDSVKGALFDSTQPAPGIGEIAHLERLLSRLERIEGRELANEYRSWADRHPGMTAALVHAGRTRELAERRALLAYLRAS